MGRFPCATQEPYPRSSRDTVRTGQRMQSMTRRGGSARPRHSRRADVRPQCSSSSRLGGSRPRELTNGWQRLEGADADGLWQRVV